jgi:hypothetical protein
MIQVSSSNVVYGKYGGLIITIGGNFLLAAKENHFSKLSDFIALNIPVFFTAGLISIYAFRLWDVAINGNAVVAKRLNTNLHFTLNDIRNIDVTPNIIMGNNAPPFVNIKLNRTIDGVTEVKYFPSKNRLDEKLLIGPWKDVYREWAQESMKRRKARR